MYAGGHPLYNDFPGPDAWLLGYHPPSASAEAKAQGLSFKVVDFTRSEKNIQK